MKVTGRHFVPGLVRARGFAVWPVVLALVCSGSHRPADAEAYQEEITGYVLYRVTAGVVTGPSNKWPTRLDADASGGLIVTEMRVTDTCEETTSFRWSFNRDIRYLPRGERFSATVIVDTDDCGPRNAENPSITVDGLGSSAPSIISRSAAERERIVFNTGMVERGENPRRVVGKSRPDQVVGQGTFKFTAETGAAEGEWAWFMVNAQASSRRGDGRVNDKDLRVQVAYLYRAVSASTSLEDLEIILDNPGPNSTTSVTGPLASPPGTAVERTPGRTGALPADPCLDPTAQQCIDEWIQLATDLRNRNQPDLGPWRVSRFGQWINAVVTGVGAPDGWATKYRGSRFCFVWMESQREHENPAYGGALPGLSDYVNDCWERGGTVPGLVDVWTGPPFDETPGSDADTIGEALPDYLLGSDSSPATGARLGNLNFELSYPPELLRWVASSAGPAAGAGLLEINPGSLGLVRIGLASSGGWTGSQMLCRLEFAVDGRPGDVAPLTGRVTAAHRTDNTKVSFAVRPGEVRIPLSPLAGDYDGNGVVDRSDALAALRMSVGLLPVRLVMDVDRDGAVTSKDARLLLDATGSSTGSSGSIVLLPPGGPLSSPAITGPTIEIRSAAGAPGEVVSIEVIAHWSP